MSNLTPNAGWDNVYQIETSDDVLAGVGGLANSQSQALLNRTEKLKNDLNTTNGVIAVLDGEVDGVAGNLSTLTGVVNGHTVDISSLNSTVSGHTSSISSLSSVDTILQNQLNFTQRVLRKKYDDVALNSSFAAVKLFTFDPIIKSESSESVAILNQIRFKLNISYSENAYAFDFEFDASEHPTSGSIQSRIKLRSISGYQGYGTTFNPSLYLIVKKVSGVYEFFYECERFNSGNHSFTLSIYDDDISTLVAGSNIRLENRINLPSSLTPISKLSNVSGASNPTTSIYYDFALMGHDSFMQIISPILAINKTPNVYNNDYVISKTTEEPIGTIKMWYGTSLNVPRGFNICDGSNGTPDLRDKFVIGAGGSLVNGAVGGSNTQSHTTTTNSAGSHSHNGSTSNAGSHAHSGSSDFTGSHTHTGSTNISNFTRSCDADGGAYPSHANHVHTFTTNMEGAHTHIISTNEIGSHSHTISTNETGSHTHAVNIASYDSRPSFMALFYIMKISRY